MTTPKVWVCQVRREVFVGGESQRCRHSGVLSGTSFCGEMELIGGEPIEWCVVHNNTRAPDGFCNSYGLSRGKPDPCQFESQIRVGP